MKETKGQFTLMDKSEFKNWIYQQDLNRKIVRIQNHHTWKPNYDSFTGDNHFKLLAGMKRSHLKRGFSDIAQHFTIFPDGTIGTGRPLDKIPAGIKGVNTGAICIENIGNFDSSGDKMSAKQRNMIIRVNSLLCHRFNLKPSDKSLVYHHWYDLNTGKRRNGEGVTKSCPGTNFFGGNSVSDAKTNFIPKIVEDLKKVKPPVDSTKHEQLPFPVHYSYTGPIKDGKRLQKFLNQFTGINLKVDGWPGRKTSDAFQKVTGYYLKGDKRIEN